MSDQVKEFLSPLQNALNAISGQVGGIKGDIMSLPESVEATRAEINKIVKRVCQDNATCTDGAFVRFVEAADESLGITAAVAETQETFDDAVTSANNIVLGVNSAMDAFSNLQDLSVVGIVTLIAEKKLTKIEDVVGLLKVSKRLPTLLGDIQSVIPNLQGVASRIQGQGAQIGTILESSWNSESAPVTAAMDEIRAVIRNNLLARIDALSDRGKQIQGLLDGLHGRGIGGVWEFKVASYRRWFDISLDMPCTTTGRASYSIAGFKTSFDYPKFYSCPYSNKIPFPNHHIPYIKLQLGNQKRSVEAVDPVAQSVDSNVVPTFGLESYHEILQDLPVSRRVQGGFYIILGTAAAVIICGVGIMAIAREVRLKGIQQAREEVKSAEKDRLLA